MLTGTKPFCPDWLNSFFKKTGSSVKRSSTILLRLPSKGFLVNFTCVIIMSFYCFDFFGLQYIFKLCTTWILPLFHVNTSRFIKKQRQNFRIVEFLLT